MPALAVNNGPRSCLFPYHCLTRMVTERTGGFMAARSGVQPVHWTIGGSGRHRRALDRKIATILWLDAELQSLDGLMIEILRYWGKQVHKFAGIWFAVISGLTVNNSEEFRCYSAAASSE